MACILMRGAEPALPTKNASGNEPICYGSAADVLERNDRRPHLPLPCPGPRGDLTKEHRMSQLRALSIVIPSYNARPLLARTLRNATPKPWGQLDP